MGNIINLFDELCEEFSGRKSKKVTKILKIFDGNKRFACYKKGIGIIVPASNKKKVVISHIDVINKFNKGFKKGKKYKVENNKLIGALDNTITNAVAILAALRYPEVEFVFTIDEETSQNSINRYLRLFFDKDVFYINLDVTNNCWNKVCAVEYEEINENLKREILINIDAGFEKYNWDDDFSEVLEYGGKGFSYCLPTKRKIHSYKNYTLIEKLEPYFEGLCFLLENRK